MASIDPRIDAYIARSAVFARPVLRHLRTLVHRACPGADETIKWAFPHFEYHGILCAMAAFQRHCAFGFWKGRLLKDASGALDSSGEAMGHLGKITGLDDLPSDAALIKLIRQAARLNEQGVSAARTPRKRSPAKPPAVPAALRDALRKKSAAAETFRSLSPSHRKEYVEWITEAKRPETKEKRIATAIQWLSLGKNLNWKYERSVKSRKP
jgi:uncharacterized protein YdeI (YjbR/CyaY-like superfamily)